MGPNHLLRTAGLMVSLATALLAGCTSSSPASVRPPDHPKLSDTGTGASTKANVSPGRPIDVRSLRGRIVFSNGTNDIWIVNANGSKLKRLTTNPREDFDPALSPDGRLIAFRSMRDGSNEVYVMDADGSHQHDVSRDPADDWGPVWSPDGRVLWNCGRDLAAGFHACVANSDGSGLHVIPNDRYFEYGAWSPDGSKIAFMSQEADAFGNDPNYNVYVMNADGSGLRRLTNAPGEDGFPSWSPDGRQIAFSTTRDDCSHSTAPDCGTSGDIGPFHSIWIMNADGSDQHRLTRQMGMFVDWSPDGRYLVFSPGLNIIRPDGSGLVSFHPSVATQAEFADWGA